MLTQPLEEDVEAASPTQRLVAIERRAIDRRQPSSPWRHVFELLADEMRWDERHRALDAHPFFRGCNHQEIRRIARMGDFIEIDAGQVLWRKWQIGYWFLVIFSGSIELRDGHTVGRVLPGGTLGADSILSFGPQQETARTKGAVVAYVIGRRHLLSLADNPILRPRLGLPSDPEEYCIELRRRRAAAAAEWRRVPQWGRARVKPEHFPANFRVYERNRAQVPLAFPAAPAPMPAQPVAVTPIPRRVWVGLALAVLSLIAAVLCLYRPPVAVVRPGEAVDVLRDIEVSGTPTYPVSGRYLLLSVRFDRPALGELLLAKARGERTVSLASDETSGLAAYGHSRTAAISYAAEAEGIEFDDLDVRIRDRRLSGPSAGLVYGLALRDLLDPVDHTRGQTIAVTGGLSLDGDVYPVWFVREKSGVVRRSSADLFIVPAGQEPAARDSGARVAGVRSVSEARVVLGRMLLR